MFCGVVCVCVCAKQECVCVCPQCAPFFPTQGHSMRKPARMLLSTGSENPGQPVSSLPLVAPQLVLTPRRPGGEASSTQLQSRNRLRIPPTGEEESPHLKGTGRQSSGEEEKLAQPRKILTQSVGIKGTPSLPLLRYEKGKGLGQHPQNKDKMYPRVKSNDLPQGSAV